MNWICEICGSDDNTRHMAVGGVYWAVICTEHLREFEDYFESKEHLQELRRIILITDWVKLHGKEEEYSDAIELQLNAHILYKDFVDEWIENRKKEEKEKLDKRFEHLGYMTGEDDEERNRS